MYHYSIIGCRIPDFLEENTINGNYNIQAP